MLLLFCSLILLKLIKLIDSLKNYQKSSQSTLLCGSTCKLISTSIWEGNVLVPNIQVFSLHRPCSCKDFFIFIFIFIIFLRFMSNRICPIINWCLGISFTVHLLCSLHIQINMCVLYVQGHIPNFKFALSYLYGTSTNH